jgi:hypothetical protein
MYAIKRMVLIVGIKIVLLEVATVILFLVADKDTRLHKM